jgi:hypothetical protein
VSRRGQIAMSAEEVAAFLAASRTVTCATNGRNGWPHLMFVERRRASWDHRKLGGTY